MLNLIAKILVQVLKFYSVDLLPLLNMETFIRVYVYLH